MKKWMIGAVCVTGLFFFAAFASGIGIQTEPAMVYAREGKITEEAKKNGVGELASPSSSPSEEPSNQPSESPSGEPSISPSETPSASPTVSPTVKPSANPATPQLTPAPLLPAVNGVKAAKVKSLTAAVVTWTAYSQASSYEIYAKCGEGNFALAGTSAVPTYTASGLKAGSTYQFIVVAVVKQAGGAIRKTVNSAPATVKLKPGKVKKFKAKSLYGKIRLSWKKGGNINGYQIQRKVHVKVRVKGFKAKFSHLKTIKSPKKTRITNVMLVRGMKYSYRIRSFKKVGGKRIYSEWTTINKKKAR